MFLKGKITSPTAINQTGRVKLTSNVISLKGVINANNTNIKDLEGKVVFINYWATWCPPCRAEMPSLNRLYTDYKDKIAFVFITNESNEDVSPYFEKYGFNFPTYNVTSGVPKELTTSSIPATFILDKQGRLALEKFGPADWNTDKVRETLDNLLAE